MTTKKLPMAASLFLSQSYPILSQLWYTVQKTRFTMANLPDFQTLVGKSLTYLNATFEVIHIRPSYTTNNLYVVWIHIQPNEFAKMNTEYFGSNINRLRMSMPDDKNELECYFGTKELEHLYEQLT